jgi:Helix-turn-helix domain
VSRRASSLSSACASRFELGQSSSTIPASQICVISFLSRAARIPCPIRSGRSGDDLAGVELAQIEADTHIRTRYLKALEDERFDLIPGDAYVRGFLRTYADYLGLDSELFVDEYKARFVPPSTSFTKRLRLSSRA